MFARTHPKRSYSLRVAARVYRKIERRGIIVHEVSSMSIAVEEEVGSQIWPSYVVLYDASWSLYELLLKEVDGQNLRLTYDEGVLEIMSPLPEDERLKKVLARMIEALSEELDISISSFGSTTFKRKALLKGTEPDECYYVKNEQKMRSRRRLDLRRDPPPDLVVEVDITHHDVDKRRVYAGLGVPELWTCDGARVQFEQLRREKYHRRETSLSFPFLHVTEVQTFLDRFNDVSETKFIKEWRKWIRDNLERRIG